MLLRQGAEEILLKVPKELRRLLDARLERGESIVVFGSEIIEKRSGLPRLVVSKIQRGSAAGAGTLGNPCLACPILVCTKKNCWRSGGKELFAALGNALLDRDLGAIVEVREIECLGHCDVAPNCEWNNHEYHNCSPKHARWIVEQIATELR
jgi:hypothetical protein